MEKRVAVTWGMETHLNIQLHEESVRKKAEPRTTVCHDAQQDENLKKEK